MKSTILILAAAAASAVSLHGQIPVGAKLIADVPFSFHQGSTMLPAGRYELSMAEARVIRVNNPKARVGAVSVVNPRGTSPSNKGYLAFQCYGATNHCFLRSISAPDSSTAMNIPQSKVEKEYGASGTARAAVIEIDRSITAGE